MSRDNHDRLVEKAMRALQRDVQAIDAGVQRLRVDPPGQGGRLTAIEVIIRPAELTPPRPQDTVEERVQALMDELVSLRP